jgi:hypothetical protein
LQKTKESKERKEKEGERRIDKHREEGQTKGGRERDRTEGEAAEDRRLVHQIPTMQP